MSNRYYDSGTDVEIKPGRISAELRVALNIAENDIPLWIYRMRALGYPPGWLKKAIVDTNDIFDTDSPTNEGQSSSSSGNSKKRKNSSNDEVVQYDHSKLIEYPGFNTPMPKNCVDYHYYINMPAMLEHQQLEYAKKHMNSHKPDGHVDKKSRSEGSLGSLNDTSIPTIDLTNDSDDEKNNSTSNESKEQDSEVKILEDEKSHKNDKLNESSSPEDIKSTAILKKTASSVSLPEHIKLVSKGSPMPKPVQRAPLEKFSEGVVGELLYFENLPTSTGKFDSIRGLLNTIRRSKSVNDTSFNSTKSDKN